MGSASNPSTESVTDSSPLSKINEVSDRIPIDTGPVVNWHDCQENRWVGNKRSPAELAPDKMCFETALLAYVQSQTSESSYLAMRYPIGRNDVVKLCFSKRRKTEATVKSVCKVVKEYYEFPMSPELVTPPPGDHAIAPMARWLATPSLRGPTVPRMGRYTLRLFGEALGINRPINHPAVVAATRTRKTKLTRHAPQVATGFISAPEHATANTAIRYSIKSCFMSFLHCKSYGDRLVSDG